MVPISSTSATKVSPPAPPMVIAANFCLPDNLLSSDAFFTPLVKLGAFKFKYVPAFFALIALFDKFKAILAPAVPKDTTCVNASVILPAAFCSATSSNGLILSKNCSTSTAVFVSKPRSTSSAPRDTIPSGIFISPDSTPFTPA